MTNPGITVTNPIVKNPDPENVTTSITPAERDAEMARRHKQETALTKIKAYAALAEVQERFVALLGNEAGRRYVESVVIAVANNDELQKCSPKSIMIQAMRAASLQLSVDPMMKQAHLVPFGSEATLIVDYHGMWQLSVNTNYYADAPDVHEVYEGETVTLDRLTGRCTLDETTRKSKTVIGWLSYYKAKNGVERWLYMTNEECDEHGKQYNPGGYNSQKSPWNAHNGRDRDKMRRKTCFRIFLGRWGNFSPLVVQTIMQDEPIDGQVTSSMPSDDFEVPSPAHDSGGPDDLGFPADGGDQMTLPMTPNPNPVKDHTWDAWLAICNLAEKVGIPHTLADRNRLIEPDLLLAIQELTKKVKKAETDAKKK